MVWFFSGIVPLPVKVFSERFSHARYAQSRPLFLRIPRPQGTPSTKDAIWATLFAFLIPSWTLIPASGIMRS